MGNSMVQEKVINWSYLIRGKDALTQINVNIIIQDFKPILKPEISPSIKG